MPTQRLPGQYSNLNDSRVQIFGALFFIYALTIGLCYRDRMTGLGSIIGLFLSAFLLLFLFISLIFYLVSKNLLRDIEELSSILKNLSFEVMELCGHGIAALFRCSRQIFQSFPFWLKGLMVFGIGISMSALFMGRIPTDNWLSNISFIGQKATEFILLFCLIGSVTQLKCRNHRVSLSLAAFITCLVFLHFMQTVTEHEKEMSESKKFGTFINDDYQKALSKLGAFDSLQRLIIDSSLGMVRGVGSLLVVLFEVWLDQWPWILRPTVGVLTLVGSFWAIFGVRLAIVTRFFSLVFSQEGIFNRRQYNERYHSQRESGFLTFWQGNQNRSRQLRNQNRIEGRGQRRSYGNQARNQDRFGDHREWEPVEYRPARRR